MNLRTGGISASPYSPSTKWDRLVTWELLVCTRRHQWRHEKVLITINALIHAKLMYITYGIYLSYIPQTETNYWSRNAEGMASSHFKCDSGWGGWVLWLQGYIALAQDPHHFDHKSSHVRTHYINMPRPPALVTAAVSSGPAATFIPVIHHAHQRVRQASTLAPVRSGLLAVTDLRGGWVLDAKEFGEQCRDGGHAEWQWWRDKWRRGWG